MIVLNTINFFKHSDFNKIIFIEITNFKLFFQYKIKIIENKTLLKNTVFLILKNYETYTRKFNIFKNVI